MDDAEVTRRAIGIFLTRWSKLESMVNGVSNNNQKQNRKMMMSDAEILRAYVDLCPFVSSSSSVMKAVVEILNNAPPTKAQQQRKAQKSTAADGYDEEEVNRVSMRITISAWSQLLVQSETLNDIEVMKLYILQCPFVSSTKSEVSMLVLQGLDQLEVSSTTTTGGGSESTTAAGNAIGGNSISTPPSSSSSLNHPVPRLSTVDSDSEESGNNNNAALGTGKKEKGKIEGDTITTSSAGSSTNITNNKLINDKPIHHRRCSIIVFLIRSVLLDIPIMVLFGTYLGLLWIQRVDQLYIVPSMKAAVWTEERQEKEITYYNRYCDSDDMTARTADELLVPTTATIYEAYQHQLHHGFSIFQNVLTQDVMDDLRNYVISRNHHLSEEESIFVIESTNRYSFGLGTEIAAVSRAVKQLATSPLLAPTLEKVLGPKPALIEMTAITASYGAISQHWHDDVIAPASAMKYGRSFGPSYSVFIQLQNTTKEMGATSTCPGSHKCSRGEIEDFCESDGFQFVDSRTGVWKAGDALLMNMNSYHRGFAHTDPNGPDRVMLILTFVPKPMDKAESRQLSQGITFSLRWDMWGHTLWDLAEADKRMKQPWATLRALGLYKPKDAAWGVDYVSSATMRMANEDNGFRRDELDTFLDRGGFHWLPAFLHGQIKEDGSWHEFLYDTLERCIEFILHMNIFLGGLYGFSLLVVYVLLPERIEGRRLGKSILRWTTLYGVVYLIWEAANTHVDHTQWAKDVRAGRRYTVNFDSEDLSPLGHLPSTLPNREDVLIETRYGSQQFHMYNDFTNDHPGTRAFHALVRKFATAFNKVDSESMQTALAAHVVSFIEEGQGRFLLQKANAWVLPPEHEVLDFVKTQLANAAYPFLGCIRQHIRFLESEYTYGIFRNTSLARKSLENLNNLKNKLLLSLPTAERASPADANLPPPMAQATAHGRQSLRNMLLIPKTIPPLAFPIRQRRVVNIAPKPTEPEVGAWLKAGDRVEGTEFLDDGEAHWYSGVLQKVDSNAIYFVAYDDKSFGVLGDNLIRPYKPYIVGEKVEVFMGDDEVDFGTIVTDHGDGTFDVVLEEEEEFIQGVPTGDLRRFRHPGDIEEERVVRNQYA